MEIVNIPLMYGISRVDNSRGHYWFVRLHYVEKKPTLQKIFNDSTHGSKKASLEAAIKFRDDNTTPETVRSHSHLPDRVREKSKDASIREGWRKEKLARRLDALKKFGSKKIYVGTGMEGALKARAMGASQVTCWKIKTGQQDFYGAVSYMPGYHLSWVDRPTKRKADRSKQKQFGKQKFVLGTGREAAIKAQEMGASQKICNRIFSGEQNFFRCCHIMPHFEINGFKQELTPEIIETIKVFAGRYAKHNSFEVAAEVMLNYASRANVPKNQSVKDFIKMLVLKYNRIINFTPVHTRHRKAVSLDINGDVEHASHDGGDDIYGVGACMESSLVEDYDPFMEESENEDYLEIS